MDANLRSRDVLTTYLQDGAWLSGLARHLVRDPAAADDLAQDTWLAFLRKGPPTDSARPWLATVLRNAARERHRSNANRARRERDAARPESSASDASSVVERAELRRHVFDIVLALDEPFRSTVLLRYAEGRSSAAIARAQGVPEGTVRWRLKEGLDRLRAYLDAKHGGNRPAWMLWIAPLVGPAPRIATGVVLVAAAGLAVLLTIAVSTLRATRVPAASDVASAPSHASPPPAVPPAANLDPAPMVTPPLRAEATAATARIVLRVVDDSARPVAGATVRIDSTATADASAPLARVMTDREGRAELAWPLTEPAFVELVIEAGGYERGLERASIAPGATVALGDFALTPGRDVAGVVVDASGNSVAGAEVFAVSHALHGAYDEPAEPSDPRERTVLGQSLSPFDAAPLPATLTNADGRFTLEGLPRDGISIFAHAAGTQWTRATADQDDAPARADLKLALIPAKSLGSSVTSPFANRDSAGARVASAPIQFDVDDPVRVRVASTKGLRISNAKLLVLDAAKQIVPCAVRREADAKGLAFLAPRADVPVFFCISAPLHGTRLVGPVEPKDVVSSIDVALEPVPLVAGVVTRAGSPVAGARVALAFDDTLNVDRGFASRAFTEFGGVTQTDADGRFALDLAHDVSRAWLSVRHESVGALLLAPTELASQPAVDALTLELRDGGSLDVSVPVAKGDVAAGFVVGVHDGLGSLLCARTDVSGIARFAHLAPGVVHVARLGRESDPYAGVGEGKRRLDARLSSTRDVAIAAADGATIVLDGAGMRSRIDGHVMLDGVAATGEAQRFVNERVLVDRALLDDGAFVLESPSAGPGRAVVRVTHGADPWAITIAKAWGGGPERIELELHTASLRGRVLAPRKERSRLTWIWKGPGGATCEERIRVADDGTFALGAILAGDAELRARDEVVATFAVAPGEVKTIDVR